MATDVSTTLAEVVIVSTLRMTSSDVVEIPVTFTASNPFYAGVHVPPAG